MDLIDIYRVLHPKAAECTFFSSAHGTFSRIDRMLGHKASLRKLKKIEIISTIFSDHSTLRLEINYKKKAVKTTNTWRLNSMLVNNQWITEEIKEEIKKYLETNENISTMIQRPMGRSKSSTSREVYSNTYNPISGNKKNHK